jgi:hypothetical protein
MSVAYWQRVVEGCAEPDHLALFYKEKAFLAEAAALYLFSALSEGRGAAVIARPSHAAAFRQALQAMGVDVAAARARGQLLLLDAEEVLGRFMTDRGPDADKFEAAIGEVLDALAPFPGAPAAYGEMVDILRESGNFAGAVDLEELWNGLLRRRKFSLFCAYAIDPLDIAQYDGRIQSICRAHSHTIPGPDVEGLERAVESSAGQVLGQSLSVMLKAMAAKDRGRLPAAQAVLMWTAENMPVTAEKLFARARALLSA